MLSPTKLLEGRPLAPPPPPVSAPMGTTAAADTVTTVVEMCANVNENVNLYSALS